MAFDKLVFLFSTYDQRAECNNLEAQLVAVNILDAQDPTDEEIYRALQNPKTFKNLKSFKRVQDL
jgi:hypothetical protein